MVAAVVVAVVMVVAIVAMEMEMERVVGRRTFLMMCTLLKLKLLCRRF